jgi:hypothetical protein
VQAGFLSCEHHGDPADFVYSRNALHHLLGETEEAIEAWLAGAAEDSVVGWTRAELGAHLRDENSTFAWLLEPMPERAGFEIREAEGGDSAYARYVCVHQPHD